MLPVTAETKSPALVAQVVSPMCEPLFSENSYGFRPNRSSEMAVREMLIFLNEGYEWIVDIDLEKFFDIVPQDKLMSLVHSIINDGDINALKKQRQLQMQNLCPAGRILRVDDYGRVIGEIDNLVFTQANGNAWYESAIISLIHRIVKKQNDFAEKENGKKLEYFTPHQIRHTYTTMAYEAGIDEKEVAFRLGHSSEATTRDVYTHLRGNKKQEQEEAINRIWIS